MRVLVPGKLVIIGEYAVVDGIPAVVAAVTAVAAAEITGMRREVFSTVAAIMSSVRRSTLTPWKITMSAEWPSGRREAFLALFLSPKRITLLMFCPLGGWAK